MNSVSGLIIFSGIIATIPQFLIARSGEIHPYLIYISMIGGYVALIPIIFLYKRRGPWLFILKRGNFPFSAAALFSITYTIAWLFLGLILENQHIKDIIGSTLRSGLPFLTAFVLYRLCQKIGGNEEKIYKSIMASLILITTIAAIGKAILLISGKLHGGGLHGYQISTAVYAFLLASLLSTRITPGKKAIALVATLSFVALSVLSLKRGNWIELAFIPFVMIAFLPIPKKSRLIISTALAAGALFLAVTSLGMSEAISSRFMYTFSGTGKTSVLDSSSQTRVNEINAAKETLNTTAFPLSWITGLGPGAGYEALSSYGLKNLNELGDYYHIHSGYFLLIFRYGFLGLLPYLAIFLFSTFWARRFALSLRLEKSIWSPSYIGLSAAIGIITLAPRMIASNAAFGSFDFGILLGALMYSISQTQTKASKSKTNQLADQSKTKREEITTSQAIKAMKH